MRRAAVVAALVALAACGSKKEEPPPAPQFIGGVSVSGADATVFARIYDGRKDLPINGVIELAISDEQGAVVCTERWEIAEPVTRFSQPFLCADSVRRNPYLMADVKLTMSDGTVWTIREQKKLVETGWESSVAGGAPTPAPAPTDPAEADRYLALLGRIAAELKTRMERMDHETTQCSGPWRELIRDATAWRLEPGGQPPASYPPPLWRVDLARLVELSGGAAAPDDGFDWLSDPQFQDLHAHQHLLADRSPILLVIRTESRARPRVITRDSSFDGGHLRGMVYAIDHATGDLLCQAPLSVKSSQKVEYTVDDTKPLDADLTFRTLDAITDARQRMHNPLWTWTPPP